MCQGMGTGVGRLGKGRAWELSPFSTPKTLSAEQTLLGFTGEDSFSFCMCLKTGKCETLQQNSDSPAYLL